MSLNAHLINHPLVQHKLTLMRKTTTSTKEFRDLLREISMLMGYELMRDLPTEGVTIDTPLETMEGRQLAGKKLALISILRAGNGFIDGLLDLVPSARVGHVGLYRDHETLEPVEYYLKVPEDLASRQVIIVDPMLATGNSAIAAVQKIKNLGATDIKFLCLIACPEGVEAFNKAHPDVAIYTAAIDRQLNDKGYILPGIGDAGDRIFGTK